MIPIEVETRIALFNFRRYLPEDVDLNLSSLLLPYYLDDEEPRLTKWLDLATKFLEQAMKEYE